MAIPRARAHATTPSRLPRRTVQARAQVTRQALLDAGRRLLAARDFSALSIAELAAAIGMSVGSFYGRFADKEAFFEELQRQVTQEWRLSIRAGLAALAPRAAPAMVQQVCALTIGLMRADAGFLRAALKHASTHPGSWSPIKQVGLDMVADLAPLLAPKLATLPKARREPQVWAAMQMVISTGLNAVLNDSGPLHLADRRLEAELARMMCAYLGLPAPRRRRATALEGAAA